MYRYVTTSEGSALVLVPELSAHDAVAIERIAERARAGFIFPEYVAENTGDQREETPAAKFFSSLYATVRQYIQRSRSRAQLARLDDRMLKDIGINRAEARRETRLWFWQA